MIFVPAAIGLSQIRLAFPGFRSVNMALQLERQLKAAQNFLVGVRTLPNYREVLIKQHGDLSRLCQSGLVDYGGCRAAFVCSRYGTVGRVRRAGEARHSSSQRQG